MIPIFSRYSDRTCSRKYSEMKLACRGVGIIDVHLTIEEISRCIPNTNPLEIALAIGIIKLEKYQKLSEYHRSKLCDREYKNKMAS